MGGVRGLRSRRLSASRTLAGRLATIAAVVILGVGCAGPTPTVPTIATSTPLPSSQAHASPGSSPATAPSASSQPPDDGTWTSVVPTGLPQTASLTPTEGGIQSVARTTAFVLTSLAGQSALDLAARVVADPPVQFAVTASGASKAILQPTAVLAAATRYRLSLARADGTIEASWTARTAGPLHITDTVPGNTATAVPLDAGVELTFDQAGVTAGAMAKSFTISPATKGDFVAKGRVVAFVPASPLRRATLYTVTVHHGLSLAGTGEVLEKDVTVQFETAASRQTQVRVWLADALVDATPRERAALTLWVDVPEGSSAPKTVAVTAHRLASLDPALAAWRSVTDSPDWTMVAAKQAVPTAGLPLLFSASVPIRQIVDGTHWIQLPRSLPAGWYVVTVTFAGMPRQLVLQITDTATYALATSTRTAVWVQDLRSGHPAIGATATLAGATLAGSANAQGLLVATTPSKVVAGDVTVPLLLVRYQGATTFRPISASSICDGCGGKGSVVGASPDHWWSLLTTDRSEYRRTDTVNLVGVAKHRVSGSVPAAVRLLVLHNGDDGATPILTQTAVPDGRGMYTASFKLVDLPPGGYWVRAMVGTEQTGESWFDVATIRKPAYAITLTTDKHAVISGQAVRTTVGAAFFEGTPVTGVTVHLMVNDTAAATVATDTTGQASAAVLPVIDEGSQVSYPSIDAIPVLPEEGQITGSAPVAVFAGSAFVSLDGTAATKTVSVSGAVNTVAWDRFEQAGVDLSAVDPRGAPRAGAVVQVAVLAHYTMRKASGTEYDFITKRVVTKYDYLDRTFALPAKSVRTGPDGKFRLVVDTTHSAYAYEVTATYADEAGRKVVNSTWINSTSGFLAYPQPWLEAVDGHADTAAYAVGDEIAIRYTAGVKTTSAARYLFVTLQQGLRTAQISSSRVFRTTFTTASVPNIAIAAVRFTGSSFEVVPGLYTARIEPSERTMTVSLTTDKTRYLPGETANVTAQTLDRNGQPVAASVFVRAIDEKLYAMGAATEDDPVPQLYADVPDGVIGSARSHQTPNPSEGGGGGDTTGGGGAGGRTDFRDWLVAKIVRTDATGRATVAIPLADDLTSWRVAATAIDSALNAGATSIKVPVGLPFFVDAVLAPQYLVADRPVVRMRSYGTSLQTGTPVTFVVSSDTLPMTATTVTADAFGSAYVPLPALSAGTHKIRIAGSATVGGENLADTMTRTFTVVASRATQLRTTWSPLTGRASVQAGAGMTHVVLVDAGRGRVVPTLEELAVPDAVRADQELASALANRVLVEQFGLPAVAAPDPNGLDVYRVEDGLAIVSWGSIELDVTALAAMARDPRLTAGNLDPLLSTVAASPDETRARRLLALAGLAALGEPVEDQITAASTQTDLTVEEQVNLALAALEAGDETLAGRLEQQILASHGFRYGQQVRIDPGPDVDAAVTTARLAIVASSLGDPVAAEMDAYVAAHPSPTTLVDLERALAARGWATRVAVVKSSAAITFDGVRQVAALDGSHAAAYDLTPAQASSASIEPVSGTVLVVQTWDAALDAASLKARDGVTMTRTVTPASAIAADDTVIVEFHVTIPPAERSAGWLLVDNVPSGLAPISYLGAVPVEESPAGFVSPTFMDGQRVAFLVGWDPKQSDYTLRYVARVVTPGAYTWETSVLQSTADPAWGLTVAPTTITIRTPGS
jgi:hypothetical protein